MPYDLKTKSGIVLRNIPDDMSPDAPELKQLVQQQLSQRAPKQPGLPMQASDPDAAARMATEGMSGWDKAMANVGAGMDSAWQGAKQLGGMVGIGPGVTDEEVRDKRMRDESLARQTTGGKFLQIAGEAAPQLLIPGGAGGGLARMAGTSALAGATGAALVPVTSDESRLGNMASGAALGGALPLAGRALRTSYEYLRPSAATTRAAREVQNIVGPDAGVMRRLDDYTAARPDIPLTSAAVAEHPGLARMEAGARAKNGAEFYDVDQRQGRAVFNKVMGDTEEAGKLAKRRSDRSDEWNSNWQTASDVADPQVFDQRMAEFVPQLQAALRTPEASNPAVRGVLDDILGEVGRLGDDFTPGHLQQIRANLNARGKALPQNAYQAAPRDSPAVNRLIDQIDGVLNDTTKGAWDAVKGGYETASRGVDASKAAGRVRESFIDSETGRVRGTAIDPHGDVPAITEAGLGRALDAARGPDKTNLLSPQAAAGLSQTLEALRQQNIVQRVKKSAVAGGGSNTTSDMIAAGVRDAAPGGGITKMLWDNVALSGNNRRDRVLAEALREPAAMKQLLQKAVSTPGELSPTEERILRGLRSWGTTYTADKLKH
jgi:hypothetical protein